MRSSRRRALSGTHARSSAAELRRRGLALSDRSCGLCRRAAGMTDAPDLIQHKDALLEAMLPDITFDGWSIAALNAGARSLGLDVGAALRLFPEGPGEAALWLDDW